MHTWSLDGYLYQDAPCCACELGRKIHKDQLQKEMVNKHG
jgi:hypothetical protein